MVTGLFVRSVLCHAFTDNLINVVAAEHEGSRLCTKPATGSDLESVSFTCH
jgi:hypothetical protein